MACHQKHKKKRPLQPKKLYFLQNSCCLFQNPLKKKCKKQVHKEYPLAAPGIRNYKLELTCAIKTTFRAHLYVCFPSSFWLNGSQSESNEDPIRAYQKREDLSEPYQKPLGESPDFWFTIAKQTTPPKKKKRRGPFTIVDAT